MRNFIKIGLMGDELFQADAGHDETNSRLSQFCERV
jgi:hypothetical protein